MNALPDGLPVPRRYWSVLTIGLAIAMSVLDSAIANVALPTIARDLDASAAASIWVVNAYQLAITISLLPLAALGDRIGYRRVYQAGLILFTAASLACALSQSLTALTLARLVQGFGAAGVMSVNGALVRFTWPHRLLGRGIGLNALVVAVSAAAGPTIASAILAAAPWPWLFAVNLPIGLTAAAVAQFALPRAGGGGRAFDGWSALLNALTFGLLITGTETLGRGSPPLGLLELAIAGVAGVLLVRRELRQPAPLVPLDLLRMPIFGLSVATSICSFAAQMLALVSLPFLFQGPLGRSVVQTGLLMTPWPLGVAVAAPVAGRLADRYPAGALGGLGLAVFSVGLLMLAFMPHDVSTFGLVARMAVCGLGFGLFQSPNNRAMMSAAPPARSGAAGGMLATARLLGQTGGATTVAMLFHLAPGRAGPLALGLAAALAAVGAGVSLLRLGRAVDHQESAAEAGLADTN